MSSSAITAPLYLDPTKAADGSAAAPSFAFANYCISNRCCK